ncbi:MAG: GyrI-like domain-containing protein [Bacteroidota bacterium]
MHTPIVVEIAPLLLVGTRMPMTLAHEQVQQLWQAFRPRIGAIEHRASQDFYSLHTFDPEITFDQIRPNTPIDKWAAVSVNQIEHLPEGCEKLVIQSGLYAIFEYVGPAAGAAQIVGYIFQEWLPNSDYQWDNRPQFERLPPGYRPDDPKAQEWLYIPIKKK